MKFLLKFVEKYKYANDVIKGSLYMNSLSYFWQINHGEPLGASNSDRYDIFEGTYLSLNKDDIGLDEEFANVIGPNPVVRLSAYKSVNLFSTYHAEYNVRSKELLVPRMDTMNEFGKFVVVITNEVEFRRRVYKAAKKASFDCVYGDVDYHPAQNRGRLVSGNMLHLIREDEIDINLIASDKNIMDHYDCLDKWNKHAYQREWRICLNRNNNEITPYRLEVGSISDIAFIVSSDMLYSTLFNWLSGGIKFENPLSFLPKYDGTVTREVFKMNVQKLRPNKGYLLTTIM
ncbi:hypothetical protein [Gudongella sp. DL1XJH-153]|uniref:hypothetical protein n=1 Tax=Gudongella sp. DL1XJH-153 TaxID=3409804 RepID=UPI003BB4FF68